MSADTIYSPESTRRLWKLVSEQLRPGGTALIAAKAYYFGVGGCVADFEKLVEELRTFQQTRAPDGVGYISDGRRQLDRVAYGGRPAEPPPVAPLHRGPEVLAPRVGPQPGGMRVLGE